VDWAERFARVRRWRRGGERAPHKPLLLLYALGLVAYEYRCAFCGYDGALDSGSWPGLEAAHVRWWTHGGPNDVTNGICLCSIHHKLFDRGVLGITDQHRITVSVHFVGRSRAAERLVLSLNGSAAGLPMKGFPAVAAVYAAWHTREVFRAPARAA
jgi:putative restriction endonuclease